MGFSQWTCVPAAMAASAISRWSALGVVIATMSTAGSATSSRQSSVAASNPNFPAIVRAVERRLAQPRQPHGRQVPEHGPGGTVCQRVRLPHEPRSD